MSSGGTYPLGIRPQFINFDAHSSHSEIILLLPSDGSANFNSHLQAGGSIHGNSVASACADTSAEIKASLPNSPTPLGSGARTPGESSAACCFTVESD